MCSNKIWLLIFFFLFQTSEKIYCQNIEFEKKIKNIESIFEINIDKAFKETTLLINEVVLRNDFLSELKLIEIRCKYFYSKKSLHLLLIEAKKLNLKSTAHNQIYFKIISNIYLAEVYRINKLFDDSLDLLNENIKIIKEYEAKFNLFSAKINTLTTIANLYNEIGNFNKAASVFKDVIKIHNLLNNLKEINNHKYINYSKFASYYFNHNIDSSKYYLNKSIKISDKLVNKNLSTHINNLITQGKIAKENGNNSEAIDYFIEAENESKKLGEKINLEEIYENLSQIYKLNKQDSLENLINYKLINLEIENLKSKNTSLQKIINDKTSNNNFKLIYLIVLIPIIILIVLSLIRFKKRKFNKKNKVLNNTLPSNEELIEMIKNNESEFIFAFEKKYSDFSKKLLNISPTISTNEIEFCAMIKLNLSTKKIAQIKFLEVRTIQNKKYKIRKKLNIPSDDDLYIWFKKNI